MKSNLIRTFCATPSCALILAAFLLPQKAMAEEVTVKNGFYVSGSVGGNFQRNDSLRVRGTTGPTSRIANDYKTGTAYNAAIGLQLDYNIVSFLKFLKPRLELEFASGRSGNKLISGRTKTESIKGILYSDIRWAQDQRIVPYFGTGIGIGIAQANFSGLSTPAAGPGTFRLKDSYTGFATHSSLGVTLKATERFDIYAEGRYTRTLGVKFDAVNATGGALRIRDKSQSFSAAVGARAHF